ncbi:MAG: hypothetical protein ABL974_14975, partial [Prosthecobacter sp.]
LLWRQQPNGEVKSTMLLGGDHSPTIKMQAQTRWTNWLLMGGSLSMMVLWWTRGRLKTASHKSAVG